VPVLNKVLLTASMIVRNEEHCLAECLHSIENIVDEIVIVDTGSSDQSKAIAKAFDARVFDFQWCDDFSAARNEALRHSRGEWILYIDADERLQPTDRPQVEHLLSDPSKAAFTLWLYPYEGFTAYREYRIFRNDPRIRFDGVIHETMLPSIRAVCAQDQLAIGKSNLAIVHTGYDGNQDRKHARNLPLLRMQLKRDPQRIFCWWHLGAVLTSLGDEEGAEEAWMSAIKIIREKDILQAVDSLPYADLIRLQHQMGKDVAELIEEALALFPDQYLLFWIKGRILMAQQDYEAAISVFQHLVSVDTDSLEGDEIAYDSRIFGLLAYEPLASCYFKLDRLEESGTYYALAEQCEPGNIEHRIKRRFVSARAKAS
jgi:tetratricopeptide (TPR) repeat protein